MTAEFRLPTGWLNYDMGVWRTIELLTTQPTDDEIFASLEYISEIDKVGLKFFKDLHLKNPRKSLLSFRAFIRQAKTFYYAAKQLNYRASTLLYYYSFLNLAKAYVTVSNPEKVTGRITHGLAYEQVKGGLNNQGVLVTKNEGVFHKLYEKETLTKIPSKLKLNIKSLLGYCTDVNYEYEMAGFGNRKVIPVKVRLLSNIKRKMVTAQATEMIEGK
jgi:hypothetical protein